MTDTLYERDFVIWTERQAGELRRLADEGSNLPLDWVNLAEEIEDLGKEIRYQVESLCFQTMVHLLKLACSPAQHFRAKWMSEVDMFRRQLNKRLAKNPSLHADLAAIVEAEEVDAFRETERLLGRFDGGRGLDTLALWRSRGFAVDDVVIDGVYPPHGGTSLIAEGGTDLR